MAIGTSPVSAATLPAGFQDVVAFSGVTGATGVRFSSDGRVFVAQKDGLLRVFDSLTDTTPATVLDLRSEVHNYWDRGLLGLALDPNFPATPYIYVLEAYDAAIGGTAPQWNDNCPTPPGPNTDGCPISGRLLRLTLSGNAVTATKVLIKDQWCQQYPSHSIGDLYFGTDGALYVSGGDGASFTFADYGQGGGGAGSPTPKNPCGDPPAGVGGDDDAAHGRGGSAAQRRASGRPSGRAGAARTAPCSASIRRPATRCPTTRLPAAPTPTRGGSSPTGCATRSASRSGRARTSSGSATSAGTRGRRSTGSPPRPRRCVNFGWPCYEGNCAAAWVPERRAQSVLVPVQRAEPRRRRTSRTTTAPTSSTDDNCPTGSSSVTGPRLLHRRQQLPGRATTAASSSATTRASCIWFMPVGSNGLPDPALRAAVRDRRAGAGRPRDRARTATCSTPI